MRKQGGATIRSGARRTRTETTVGGEGVDRGTVEENGAAMDDIGVPDMSAVVGLLLGVTDEGIFRKVVCFL